MSVLEERALTKQEVFSENLDFKMLVANAGKI